jgi:hypothetical protein
MGGWRKLHSEELHNLYSLPNIMVKSRRMRYVGHVAWMGEKRNECKIWWESQKGRDHYKDLGEWILLKHPPNHLENILAETTCLVVSSVT